MRPARGGSGVAIVGAGGHAKVVLSALIAAGEQVDALYDDDPQLSGKTILGIPVVGPIEAVGMDRGGSLVIGVGDNRCRRGISTRLDAHKWRSVRHPMSWVDPSVTVEDGAVVFAGAIAQPDTFVGKHAILNTGCTVDHDCRVGAYAHLAPGVHLCGGVSVGEGALLGAGSVVTPGVRIGEWAVVGAGAVVVNDVPAGSTVAGVPARSLRG